MADLVLATRGSALAMAQAGAVAATLARLHPGIDVELLVVTTAGDRDRTSPVADLTEMGAFVRAVQEAVLDGRAGAAVHSGKDLPVAGPSGLDAVYPAREAPWDVLCGSDLAGLPSGARVGTGSPRRAAQLGLLRPDVTVTDIRGNVDSRLALVASGELDAVVLAEAGLRRLDRGDEVAHRFGPEEMVPAPAQGALTVEFATDGGAGDLLAPLDDDVTRRAVTAERGVLALTSLGCRAALGAHATPGDDGTVALTGFVADAGGARRATVTGPDADAPAALCQALGLEQVG